MVLPSGSTILMSARILLVPAVLTAFSAVVIWASLQLELSPAMIVGHSMQPRAFPIFLMAVNLVLVAVLVTQTIRRPPKPIPLEPLATWGSILLMLVFYGLAVSLDMFVGIAVVMFAMCRLWGERRILVAGSLALATPFSIFVLFDTVLKVRFPRSVLTNWYYG